MRHDSLLYVYSNFINKSLLYTLCTYGIAEYYKNDLSKMIDLFPMVHSYIYILCQSCDCHVFSLAAILGNMYNLCKLHSLICMCSGCHSLSDCTFLHNYRCKYRYEASPFYKRIFYDRVNGTLQYTSIRIISIACIV